MIFIYHKKVFKSIDETCFVIFLYKNNLIVITR